MLSAENQCNISGCKCCNGWPQEVDDAGLLLLLLAPL
jgi:hypothetical protein